MKQAIFYLLIVKKPVETEESKDDLLKVHSGGVYIQCSWGRQVHY